jgi:hypothetical protein
VPGGQLAQLLRLVGGQDQVRPAAAGPDAHRHPVEVTAGQPPDGRRDLTAVGGGRGGDQAELFAVEPVRRVGLPSERPLPVIRIGHRVGHPDLPPGQVRQRLEGLLPRRRQHPAQVRGPGDGVAAHGGERGGQVEDDREGADGGLADHRGPGGRALRRRADQHPGAGPIGGDRVQPADPVPAVHQQQSPRHRAARHRAARHRAARHRAARHRAARHRAAGPRVGGRERRRGRRGDHGAGWQLGIGRVVAAQVPDQPGGRLPGPGRPRSLAAQPHEAAPDQGAVRGEAAVRRVVRLGGEDPRQGGQGEPGQLHRVLHVGDQALAGGRQLDRGEQGEDLGGAGRDGPGQGREPGGVAERGGERRTGRGQLRREQRAGGGDPFRTGAVEPGQRGQGPLHLVVTDVEAGEVARRPALGEPADQGLTLQQRVGQGDPGLGRGVHRLRSRPRGWPPRPLGHGSGSSAW